MSSINPMNFTPVQENRDHDLMINMVEGLIRGLNKTINARSTKATAINAEIKQLGQDPATRANAESTPEAKIAIANYESAVKKSSALEEQQKHAQYLTKIEEFEHINREISKLEKRRQQLFDWIRRMKTLDANATAESRNQAEYLQMQQQLYKNLQEYQKEPIDAMKEQEELQKIIKQCDQILTVLNEEKQAHQKIIKAYENVIQVSVKGQNILDKLLKDTNEHMHGLDVRIMALQQKKNQYPEDSLKFKQLTKLEKRLYEEKLDAQELYTKVTSANKSDVENLSLLQVALKKEETEEALIDSTIQAVEATRTQCKEKLTSIHNPDHHQSSAQNPGVATKDLGQEFHGVEEKFEAQHKTGAANDRIAIAKQRAKASETLLAEIAKYQEQLNNSSLVFANATIELQLTQDKHNALLYKEDVEDIKLTDNEKQELKILSEKKSSLKKQRDELQGKCANLRTIIAQLTRESQEAKKPSSSALDEHPKEITPLHDKTVADAKHLNEKVITEQPDPTTAKDKKPRCDGPN